MFTKINTTTAKSNTKPKQPDKKTTNIGTN